MKILEVKSLKIPDVKVVRFGRFGDNRGYFTETYRRSDFENSPETSFLKGVKFTQANESFSKKGTIRGLHFQWNPYMAKLVRTVQGHMIDLALDIRLNSPNFGKIIAYDLPNKSERDFDEWIFIPVGFAHGVFLPENGVIEYFCTGEYSPNCETGISPLASDINWQFVPVEIKKQFDEMARVTEYMSEKDKKGLTVHQWKEDERAQNFIYGKVPIN